MLSNAFKHIRRATAALTNAQVQRYDAAFTPQEPAFPILTNLITADGKIPFADAIEMLGEPDASLLAALENEREAQFVTSAELETQDALAAKRDEIIITVWRNSLRRIFLRQTGEALEGQAPLELSILGNCRIGKAAFENAVLKANAAILEEHQLRSSLDSLLRKAAASNELAGMLDTLDDAVRHVESLCLYIDDEFFAVVERFTNLLGVGAEKNRSLFQNLRLLPHDQWKDNHRFLVVALYALFISGRPVRFEEFSGKVLTAKRLLRKLDSLAGSYGIGTPLVSHEPHRILELAGKIGAFALNKAPEGVLRYRYVNGVAFLKTEKVVRQSNQDDSLEGLSSRLSTLYKRLYKNTKPPESARAFFTKLARDAINDHPASEFDSWLAGTPAKTPIEAVIQEIVASAVMAVGADYGMSSSLRCPEVLARSTPEDVPAAMLKLTTQDFYNCVVSRPGLGEEIGRPISEAIYRPVQSRMQFNRWHFIPGNFRREQIPASRHYFFPPVLPDMDEWVDQNHTGHIRSQVRYSIRSPGPDIHEPPLMIGGHPYRGFYDVRVVRMRGVPFSLDNLLMVRRHCLWMGAMWRVLIEALDGSGSEQPGLRIRGFQLGEGLEIPELV